MDNISFAQRMIGAIILLSLAIIFVPMILEPEDELTESIRGTNIPTMPDNVATMVFQMNNEGVFQALEEQSEKDDEVSIKKAIETAKKTLPEKVQADEQTDVAEETVATNDAVITQGAAITWMVQLGSFGKKANAEGLRDKLRKSGYASYLRERKTDKGSIWQVRVGPELSAKKSSDLKLKLEKLTGLDALVVRHP